MDATHLWAVVGHALLYGGVLSAVLSALLLGLLWINHFRGFLVGIVLILVASGLIAAVIAALF